MKIRGILDFELPYYCDNEKPETQHLPRIPTTYTLATKQKPAATWKGLTCRQWTKTKKITGSFWIGSFDTVYSQEKILITPLECWRMVNDKKCGERKWYAIKEYQTLNCIAEQITLRQEKPDHLIKSPFGLLNTTQQEGQFIQNHNTIVWGERTTNSSYTQTLLKGKGYLEIPREPESDNSSRLYDTSRQIEISFLNKPDKDIVPISVSDFLNLPDLTQIQIIACVLKSVPNPKLEKISKIQSKSNPNPNPNHFKFEKIRSKSDPNPIQIQSNSQSIVNFMIATCSFRFLKLD
ncbi:hypothetical protein OUZ56_021689 [Daphnia magna]|uniref:Uncharacterized protein n=1 Tax=Daphnia magna TaxID=35525 RepID=A0ABR0AU86_9CRUS|nr:hypothetical protein OUZ56_021689 [Daphnia magna]